MGSEDWMNVTPESLDAMLSARFGGEAPDGDCSIPAEVDKFLHRVSDMAGVEDREEVGVRLDPDKLVESMKKLLGGDVHEEDDSDSDNSDAEWAESGEQDPVMVDYMERLDSEVASVGSDMPDVDKPMEVDGSVLANLLASYQAQSGMAGPTTSLLHPLGINPRKQASGPKL